MVQGHKKGDGKKAEGAAKAEGAQSAEAAAVAVIAAASGAVGCLASRAGGDRPDAARACPFAAAAGLDAGNRMIWPNHDREADRAFHARRGALEAAIATRTGGEGSDSVITRAQVYEAYLLSGGAPGVPGEQTAKTG